MGHVCTIVSSLNKNLDALLSLYAHQKKEIQRDAVINSYKKHKASLLSYENMIHNWKKFRNSYPDVIEPLLGSVTEFLYGLKMKLALMKKMLISLDHWKMGIKITEIINLVKMPVLDEKQYSYEKYIENLTKPKILNFVEHVLHEPEKSFRTQKIR